MAGVPIRMRGTGFRSSRPPVLRGTAAGPASQAVADRADAVAPGDVLGLRDARADRRCVALPTCASLDVDLRRGVRAARRDLDLREQPAPGPGRFLPLRRG